MPALASRLLMAERLSDAKANYKGKLHISFPHGEGARRWPMKMGTLFVRCSPMIPRPATRPNRQSCEALRICTTARRRLLSARSLSTTESWDADHRGRQDRSERRPPRLKARHSRKGDGTREQVMRYDNGTDEKAACEPPGSSTAA